MRVWEVRIRFHPGYGHGRLMAWRQGTLMGFSWDSWRNAGDRNIPEQIECQLGLVYEEGYGVKRYPLVMPTLIKRPKDLEMLFPPERIIYGSDGVYVTLRRLSPKSFETPLSEQSQRD